MERKELFERINACHNENVIVSLSGKLIKKCNLTTQGEAANLCEPEVHILKERGEFEKAGAIVAVMDQYLKSSPLTDAQELTRRQRFTYDYICNDAKKRHRNLTEKYFRSKHIF